MAEMTGNRLIHESPENDAALQGWVGEIAAMLNVKLFVLRGGGGGRILPLFSPSSPHTEIKSRDGN
jgi:hypothetical protein